MMLRLPSTVVPLLCVDQLAQTIIVTLLVL